MRCFIALIATAAALQLRSRTRDCCYDCAADCWPGYHLCDGAPDPCSLSTPKADPAAAIKAKYPKTFATPDLYAKAGIKKDAASPVEWTAAVVPGKSCLNRPEGDAALMNAFWADPEVDQIPQTSADVDRKEFKKWLATCGEHKKLGIPLRERTSLEGDGQLHFFPDGRPMNPVVFEAGGLKNHRISTGLKGRGTLGQWGPNPAADPVVARFHEGKWQVVVIQRGDTNAPEWAIPGGMVDSAEYVQRKIGEDPRPDEGTMRTALRELHEEAIREKHDRAGAEEDDFFDKMIQISELLYNGYVDDARNGDNAWMETSSYLFNMEKNGELSKIGARLELHAGDDAVKSAWMNMEDFEGSATPMFSETHRMFINRAYAAVKKWQKAQQQLRFMCNDLPGTATGPYGCD